MKKLAVKVAFAMALALMVGPLASSLAPSRTATRSALDNVFTGTAYACNNKVCAIHFGTGLWYCAGNNTGEYCIVAPGGGSCESGPCD